MSDSPYVQNVRTMRDFLRTLQPWFKTSIFLVGLITGFSVWFTGLVSVFPIIALIFLGTGIPAMVFKVLVVLAVMALFVIVESLVVWLFYLLTYAISYVFVMGNENSSIGNFIFKKV